MIILILFSLIARSQNNGNPGIVQLKIGSHQIFWPIDSTNKSKNYIKFGAKGEDLSKCKSDTTKFKFYTNNFGTDFSRQISFYFDWSNIPRIERIVEKNYSWFRPLVFNKSDTINGYFDIFLTCKSKQGDWCEVIINEDTKETLWIKNTKNVKFITWKKFVKKDYWLTVHLEKDKSNHIYSRPNINSNVISYTGIDCFKAIKVKGNWMQISNKYEEHCGYYETMFVHKVWVQFKTNDMLLIDMRK
jgi:hypothetical protein